MVKNAAIIIPLLFSSCLCQYAMDLGMRPDVTFGEQNERFDVATIIEDQSRMDIANQADEYRRHGKRRENENNEDVRNGSEDDNEKNEGQDVINAKDNEGNEKELDKGDELLNALKDTVASLNMRNFAYHSNMESSPDDNDYEKNLAAFGKRRNLQEMMDYLHGGHKNGRRSPPDPENEILFNYGVPINMKVEGFLQVPLEER